MARDATRVLVVEDDQTVAEIYRLSLERAGFEVAVAKDGLDCLEQSARQAPDFIFLDIRTPRMDGVEALRNLTANGATAGVPVVMLSNFDDPGLVRQCRELGAKEYLVKAGLNPADLAEVVARWVGKTT
jgi:CheY-like chemotaxis protein